MRIVKFQLIVFLFFLYVPLAFSSSTYSKDEIHQELQTYVIAETQKLSAEEGDRLNDIIYYVLELEPEAFNGLVSEYLIEYANSSKNRNGIQLILEKIALYQANSLAIEQEDSIVEHAVDGAFWGSTAVIAGRIIHKFFPRKISIFTNFAKNIFLQSNRKALVVAKKVGVPLERARPWQWMAAGTGAGTILGSLEGMQERWWKTKKVDVRALLTALQNYIVLEEVALEACIWKKRVEYEFIEKPEAGMASIYDLARLRAKEFQEWHQGIQSWLLFLPSLDIATEVDLRKAEQILASPNILDRLQAKRRPYVKDILLAEKCAIPSAPIEIDSSTILKDIDRTALLLKSIVDF